MKSMLIALAATLALGSGAAAQPADGEPALAAAHAALQSGVDAADANAVLKARAMFAGLVADRPDDAALHLALALAEWRAVPLVMQSDKKRAEKHCEAGIASAERAIDLNPRLAEAHALLAGLQGLSLSFKNPMAGMTLGPKMDESLERAVTLEPKNPRVHLMKGINTLHMPSFVGGGPKKAMPVFEEAIALFDAAPEAGGWGRDDAMLWAGRTAMKLDDPARARDFYRRALEANPANAWVRKRLLPDAEAALAKKGS